MPRLDALADTVWYGDGAAAAAGRALLAPLALAYRGVISARGALYERGVLPSHDLALPALGVGNVTVGGTGKTPVATWIARRLRDAGALPAIVLRGYGGDEPAVHAALNPTVPVVVTRDRVLGASEARGVGADVVVLDDAFQHRRARRVVDVVLVSAERYGDNASVRVLPAGPYREPLSALGRADAVIVTRKSATAEEAARVVERIRGARSSLEIAQVLLALDELREWPAGARPSDRAVGEAPRQALATLDGRRALAVAAVGDPAAFFTQLRDAGAVVDPAPFRDHHRFTAAEVAALAERAARADVVVCTLKDAVKLGPAWPRLASPLWYVSQRVEVERGTKVVEACLTRLLAARPTEP